MSKLTKLSLGLNLILILTIAVFILQTNRTKALKKHQMGPEIGDHTSIENYEKFSPQHTAYTEAESEAFATGIDELINNGFIDTVDIAQHIVIVDEEKWNQLSAEQMHLRASVIGAYFQHKTGDGTLTFRSKKTEIDLAVLTQNGFQIRERY